MTSKEIRQKFLDFFEAKGHSIVKSAPLVIKNDPTLMFTNAGMNQFKDIFLGNKASKTNRAADSQKCLRVSGKHNDLEAVGRDGYHHTMFEMLGNWSFGDYFKTEAIDWAWELLTEVYKIDKTKLYVTVFEGSPEDGTSADEEARSAWKKHLPESHILYGNKHDNFWEMGDTGPCGPCSEIHIDLRSDEDIAKVPGSELVNKDNPLVIEIWNLVFMQYNRKSDSSLELLPAKNIDTGMGFERLCMVLQGKTSNYDTDVFTGIISKIEEFSGFKYKAGEKTDIAMRVIADHIRAIAFSIADGQLPSNVKAGYVIRRILRRAVRYGFTFLGLDEPFLCRLTDKLAEEMGDAYPEIKAQKALIENVIREEEMAFLRTLDRGIKLLEEYMEKNSDTKSIPGEDAFVLYDTFGFPPDLTELMASEQGYKVDLKGFEEQMLLQKERARNATSNEFGDWTEFCPGEEASFTGYDSVEEKDVVLVKHRTVRQKSRTLYQLVFDKTPFYAEMGGQKGDSGYIISDSGEKIQILDTVKENDLTIHIAERIPEDCLSKFTLVVNSEERRRIEANHTATHLADYVLKEVLGSHVEQKGSYICSEYFRFDFSHFSKVTDEQIREIEKKVNQLIREDFKLEENRCATMEEAKAMGAVALFGEKYGDIVRYVKFGPSIELCGGTHISSTGKIGLFKIIGESAVAAGVRRIEVVTGEFAEEYMNKQADIMTEAKRILNSNDICGAVSKLQAEHSLLKKRVEMLMEEKSSALAKELISSAQDFGNMKIAIIRGKAESEIVSNIASIISLETSDIALAGAYEQGGKPNLILAYSASLQKKGKHAGKDIKQAAALIEGGGGGRAAFASAGGKKPEGLDEALKALIEIAKS